MASGPISALRMQGAELRRAVSVLLAGGACHLAAAGQQPAPLAVATGSAPAEVLCGDLLAFAGWLRSHDPAARCPDVDFSRQWVFGAPWLAGRVGWRAESVGGIGRLVVEADRGTAAPRPGRYWVLPRLDEGFEVHVRRGPSAASIARVFAATGLVAAPVLPILRLQVQPATDREGACLRFTAPEPFAAWCAAGGPNGMAAGLPNRGCDWVDFGRAVVLAVTAPGLAPAAATLPQVAEEEGVDVLTLAWDGPAAPAATLLCAVARRPHPLAVVLRPTPAALAAGAAERTAAVFGPD
jgi:hypothetical protein